MCLGCWGALPVRWVLVKAAGPFIASHVLEARMHRDSAARCAFSAEPRSAGQCGWEAVAQQKLLQCTLHPPTCACIYSRRGPLPFCPLQRRRGGGVCAGRGAGGQGEGDHRRARRLRGDRVHRRRHLCAGRWGGGRQAGPMVRVLVGAAAAFWRAPQEFAPLPRARRQCSAAHAGCKAPAPRSKGSQSVAAKLCEFRWQSAQLSGKLY